MDPLPDPLLLIPLMDPLTDPLFLVPPPMDLLLVPLLLVPPPLLNPLPGPLLTPLSPLLCQPLLCQPPLSPAHPDPPLLCLLLILLYLPPLSPRGSTISARLFRSRATCKRNASTGPFPPCQGRRLQPRESSRHCSISHKLTRMSRALCSRCPSTHSCTSSWARSLGHVKGRS